MNKLILYIAVPVLLVVALAHFGTSIRNEKNDLVAKPADEVLEQGLSRFLPEVKGENVKGILINRWATWCGPCIQEIPDLNVLVEKYAEQGIVFLAVSDESDDFVNEWIAKRENFDFKYKMINGNAELVALLNYWDTAGGGEAIPIHYLMRPDGKIEQVLLGAMDENIRKIEKFIEKQLAN
jgi:thiol-disulfide isomerase/thioredoxin